ncbi:aminodeoxychorismate lyase [Jatrophihabitans sp. DSM 45814]
MGIGLVDPDDTVVAADDLGLTRGDGCFEATRVVTSLDSDRRNTHRIDHLGDHLRRLQASAAALDLPDVDVEGWQDLIGEILFGWDCVGEAILRLMLTRGRESLPTAPRTPTLPVTGIATLTQLSETTLRQRREGVSAITLSRGTASDAYLDAPWLLGGVKTLSYAVNIAAGRFALKRGADDVIFTSSDDFVLEGPTSAVVWRESGQLYTTPTKGTGILDSITQRSLFAAAGEVGWSTGYRLGTVSELAAADGVWLVSSGRGAAQVHTLNGRRLRTSRELTTQIQTLAGF